MRTRDNNKEELVKETAIKMIVKNGMEGFSMNKLAKECGISVATLYIYYKDRDGLIISIASEGGKMFNDALIKGFDPEASFEEGLRVQWQNRYQFNKQHPHLAMFFDQLRSSSYQKEFLSGFLQEFRQLMGKFMCNIIERGEIEEMPFESYWSIAYSPLYALARFDYEGRSHSGKPFVLTEEILWETFKRVVKGLKK
ncbi:TetR/AcrR family transcriptional regulator [Mucilaginibacter pedocola]|uniref:TetR family transcriptional regulator n=1 Tax=Mucilaginibacter pedocola TaxID=1792845 RepID=A0A1S9PIA7_9SPHI|nr:TetR/AcrR family transcriptional regulator [Mucilaginibacter pedocola]OOQ60674.1 TetR family transcriptional regulator [Mucilaginibacter pedocola]